ncbi:MAG: beta-Ala-His dipeptidase, partial [Candidatus Aegiribacteria sp.]|nr:beta-Ala-His dipeptidase [Candidatus Aegiribacteria sp.]
HPFLECLFTTDEERGLTGAAHLDSEWITSKRLINLDSEDEGVFTIGCAGGLDFTVSMNFERMDIPAEYYRLEITGLRGGHSGMEISKNRGSAIRFLGRVLHKICSHHNCLIADIEGGSKRNAIPRTAVALISIPNQSVDAVRELIQRVAIELEREFEGIEEGIEITLHTASTDKKPVSQENSIRIINLLLSMPHGVEKMSGVVPGLVETSVNMAIASMKENVFILEFAARSPVDSAKQALAARAAAIAELAGCDFRAGSAYPGWIPDSDSALLRKIVNIYREVTGNEPVIETIHAGLECGIIGDRIAGMEMISMGPNIRDVHIPGEKVSISSLQRFWIFFKSVLEFLN